ncbi:MAG: hypothetical protein DDT19_00768 [Syntrophomonadaceae bacterium]|nr:hypothetical protein [Bacillota bacterium]
MKTKSIQNRLEALYNDIAVTAPAMPETDIEEAIAGIDIVGRVSRGNLQTISPDGVISNYIRHNMTDYDDLVRVLGKEVARAKVQSTVDAVMNFWKGRPLVEFSKKDIKRLKETFVSDNFAELERERGGVRAVGKE